MLKKTMTYTDFDGNERKETFYFNLTKAELSDMQLSSNGGLEAQIKRLIEEQDSARIVEIFKEIILKSYGEKSLDGKYFEKSEAISKRFASTNAFSDLYMELLSDANAAADFIKGIIPPEMAKEVGNNQLAEVV